ncbi:MAG: histidine kinase dimerization/phospho-acceptor domain-containing protein, partial [Pseudomonadota bacterium]
QEFCNHLGVLLDNAQLFDEISRKDRAKDLFLASLSHELRNPLQPIAYANTLLGKLTGGNPELPRLHAIIERQMNHMTRLIDDLLDASRISSGKIGLDKSALLLEDIVALAAEGSQQRLDARQQ